MPHRLRTRRAALIGAAAAAGTLALRLVAFPVAGSVLSGGDAPASTARKNIKDVRDLTPAEKKVRVKVINMATVTSDSEYLGSTQAPHTAVHTYRRLLEGRQRRSHDGSHPQHHVFFVHHANVDRILVASEQAQRQHDRPQGGAEQGWNGTLRNGYRYASLGSRSCDRPTSRVGHDRADGA